MALLRVADPPRNRKPRRLGRDLILCDSITHDISGARLILARDRRDGVYITGWAAPWQRTLRDYHERKTEFGARWLFTRMQFHAPPQTPALTRDWQVNAVYGWEEATLDAASPTLTPDQMKNVTRSLCKDFNCAAAPRLTYKKPRKNNTPVSYFYSGSNHIKMGHDTLSALIHELAHKIDIEQNGNSWAFHGPSFVRTLLALSARYQYWHDPAALETAARAHGLKIAPPTIPAARPL